MELHKENSQYQEKRRGHEAPGFRRYRPKSILDAYRGHCTFCGAPVEPDERFCTECGNNLQGITCPHCGTLNHRSFCTKCFAPLNERAQQALSEARFDPHFQRAQQLLREMEELEKVIGEAKPANQYVEEPDRSVTLSDDNRQILDSYSELFAGLSSPSAPAAPEDNHESAARARERKQFRIQKAEDAMKQYQAKMAELQMHIDAMMPPTAATPEEQRDFFSARMIITTKVEIELIRQEWVCNYCGCHHKCPNECAEPQLGGKWIFEEKPKIVEDRQTVFD